MSKVHTVCISNIAARYWSYSCQKQPAAARSRQEQPEAAKSSEEQPGAARSRQQQLGAARSSQGTSSDAPGTYRVYSEDVCSLLAIRMLEAARRSQKLLGAIRSSQEQLGAARKARNNKEEPGAARYLYWL